MTELKLRISAELGLPLDAVTQAIAILARRGAGKTYTASVLIEEVVKRRQPVVVLDPTGAWWGLRSSADGQEPGLPVVILGGEHGDVPLEQTAGRVIADLVIDHPGAYVIDLSGFESRRAEQRFAADFLERLYRGKATKREALLVVLDEADLFAPQRPDGEQIRTLGATEAIVRRGRIRGLGIVLISQRAAVLNKNVLTQSEVLVAGQTTGPQDRAAIDEWIKGNGTADERGQVLDSLASLERGEVWIWSPAWLRTLKRIRIRRRETYDSSRTPEAGEQLVAPQAFADVDLEALGERIAATVEKAKADDPAHLRRQIAELRADIAKERRAAAMLEELRNREPERIEVPVLNGQVERLAEVLDELRIVGDRLATVGDRVIDAADDIASAITNAGTGVATTPRPAAHPQASRSSAVSGQRTGAPVQPLSPAGGDTGRAPGLRAGASSGSPEAGVPTLRSPVAALQAVIPPGSPSSDERPLSGYGRRLLETLAKRHPARLTKSQLGMLSGSSRKSSSFDGATAEIRRRGLADLTAEGYGLTAYGWAELGDTPMVAQSSAELRDHWRRALPPAPLALFEVLVDVYPGALGRAELAERSRKPDGTSYSTTSSTFQAAVPYLKTAGLAIEESGAVQANPILFTDEDNR